MFSIGSARSQAGEPGLPHMSNESKPPASCIAMSISGGHSFCDGARYPDSDAANLYWRGCQAAIVNAALPDIDSPTTALPKGSWPRLAGSHVGISLVRNVSHLYVSA